MFGYMYMFPQNTVFMMEIFVLIAGQEDSLLGGAIFASPHDASSLAHVTLKFSLSVTNHRNENNEIFASFLNKLRLCAHTHIQPQFEENNGIWQDSTYLNRPYTLLQQTVTREVLHNKHDTQYNHHTLFQQGKY
jgi:hypothetical protein